jgi:hypothetical protein
LSGVSMVVDGSSPAAAAPDAATLAMFEELRGQLAALRVELASERATNVALTGPPQLTLDAAAVVAASRGLPAVLLPIAQALVQAVTPMEELEGAPPPREVFLRAVWECVWRAERAPVSVVPGGSGGGGASQGGGSGWVPTTALAKLEQGDKSFFLANGVVFYQPKSGGRPLDTSQPPAKPCKWCTGVFHWFWECPLGPMRTASSQANPSAGPSAFGTATLSCFRCQAVGHFARDCPRS